MVMGAYTDSLREAARRLLRCQGGTLYIPRKWISDAEGLVLKVSDLVPSKIVAPKIESVSGEHISYTNDEDLNFHIGIDEPDLSYCWIKADMSETGHCWDDFSLMVIKLASAGYPGCVGCGGPGSEGPWDEKTARKY